MSLAIVALAWEESWEGTLRGTSGSGRIDAVLLRKNREGAAVLAMPIAVATYDINPTSIDGTMYHLLCEHPAFLGAGIPCQQELPTISRSDDTFSVWFFSEGWDVEPPEEGCRYFHRYVDTLDTTRRQQLSDSGSHLSRMEFALDTVDDFLRAAAYGESLGLELSCIDGAGLAHRDPDSHYDEWFRIWFTEGMAHHNERIGSTSGESRMQALLDRFNFLIRGAYYSDYGLFSPGLFTDLELFEASPLLDACYGEYFDIAFASWLERVTVSPASLEAALGWLENQNLVRDLGLISSQKAVSLGLTGSPSAGETALRATAEASQ
jgi:hypothetical protein